MPTEFCWGIVAGIGGCCIGGIFLHIRQYYQNRRMRDIMQPMVDGAIDETFREFAKHKPADGFRQDTLEDVKKNVTIASGSCVQLFAVWVKMADDIDGDTPTTKDVSRTIEGIQEKLGTILHRANQLGAVPVAFGAIHGLDRQVI